MPRKDPVTGCMVMTLPEFLNAEAEHEGKGRTGADVLEEIMSDMDSDDRRQEERLKQDPELLFKELSVICNETSMSLVRDWEDWFDSHFHHAAELKDGFRKAWKHEPPEHRQWYKSLKAYAAYRKDIFAKMHGREPDKSVPHPVSLVKVLDAHVGSGFNSSGSQAELLVRCDDGKLRVAVMTHSYWGGSRLQPPEEDDDLSWREPKPEELA